MCGIAGIWTFEGTDPEQATCTRRMSNLLQHRGPDDLGYLFLDSRTGVHELNRGGEHGVTADISLAHRRLSIIDISDHGWQPMQNEDGTVFLVFNGEIYNYLELRHELEACGHVFTSHTDSEVIIHAYEEWGSECCRRFNGMWAYVLWDQRARRLICSRDRFGIKPFFYAQRKGRFLFASEVKAVLAGLGEKARPNLSAISTFLVPDWRPGDNSVFVEGISALKPAHQLVVTREGTTVSRYWDYDQPTHHYDYSAPQETFRELFSDSVRLRLQSNVPVSILLSGGVDSTAIAACVSQMPPRDPMHAFTSVMSGMAFDEGDLACESAKDFNMLYHPVAYNPDDLLEDLAGVIRSQDMPPFSSQVLQRWRLLKQVSEYGKVVLEGQGADELLGGYITVYFFAYLRDELRHFNPIGVRDFSTRMNAAFTMFAGNLYGPRTLRHLWKYYENIRSKRSLCMRVLSPDLMKHYKPGLPDDFNVPDLPDHLARKLHQDHANMLLPALLRFGDSISMAHSVESRLPFLDYRLVEYIFQLRYAWKINGCWTKNILRRSFEQELPTAVREKTIKLGFNNPINLWMQRLTEDTVIPRVCGPESRTHHLYDHKLLLENLQGCRDGNWRFTSTAFRTLGLELWHREYIDRDWSNA